MILEIYPAEGLTRGSPLRINASQLLVRQNNGTPIMVAAEYGGDHRSQEVAKVGDPDFEYLLKKLGIHMTVIADELILPAAPSGARLVVDPLTRR